MKKRKVNSGFFNISALIFLMLLMFISMNLGRFHIGADKSAAILLSKIKHVDQIWTDQEHAILIYTRVPRIILSVLVGASLAGAGAVYQGIFKNPIVSPDILGASTGAAFGASLAIIMDLGGYFTMILSFVFSILTVAIVYLISLGSNKLDRTLSLVLSGIMVSALFKSATSCLKLMADPNSQLPQIMYWLMGSLNGSKYSDIKHILIPILAGNVLIYLLRWQINYLTMGDREALAMGIPVEVLRFVLVISATLITAASISVCGLIGWIGLVIPHFARMIVGDNYSKLYPATIIMGGGFLLIVDDISRLLMKSEIPISILTSLVGAPFFLYLLRRK